MEETAAQPANEQILGTMDPAELPDTKDAMHRTEYTPTEEGLARRQELYHAEPEVSPPDEPGRLASAELLDLQLAAHRAEVALSWENSRDIMTLSRVNLWCRGHDPGSFRVAGIIFVVAREIPAVICNPGPLTTPRE